MEFDIYQVEEDYKPDDDLFSNDDFEIAKLKKIVYGKLSETDRRIMLAYAELKSVRLTARLFKVSSTTIWKRIKEIRKNIYGYIDS